MNADLSFEGHYFTTFFLPDESPFATLAQGIIDHLNKERTALDQPLLVLADLQYTITLSLKDPLTSATQTKETAP